MTTDLSTSVIMPREDFHEMQALASQPMSGKDRVASTVQTTLIFGAMAAAVAAGSYGWAKSMDWLEERRFKRTKAEAEIKYGPRKI